MKKLLLPLLAVVILAVSGTTMAAPTPTPGCIDAWSATSTTNGPNGRSHHTAVWTGSEMIVWGGEAVDYSNNGARYHPDTDSWVPVSATNTPSARAHHTAVWTGSEMIVWGGADGSSYLNSGGRYNPVTNTWTATSTTDAPSLRVLHHAVWTGSEMIVWGGYDGSDLNSGGRYNPATDTWTAISTTNAPTGRSYHTIVWTGSEMIVWGGQSNNGNVFGTGGKYNPTTDTWTVTSPTNAPASRSNHTAVWTGSEMIVWGGYDTGGTGLNSGGKYNPGTDTWAATSTMNAPGGRNSLSGVWTGSEMIVWGGYGPPAVNTGGRYNPGTDSWTPTSTTNAPGVRYDHSTVWTGTEMIVWGGTNNDLMVVNTGGRYCSQPTTSPTPTPTSSPSPTPPATPTPTPTPPHTPTPTPTTDPTATATATPTTPPPTPTPTIPPTPSPTPTPFGNTCGWSSAPAYPIEIYNQAVTSLGDYIYAFGGDQSATTNNAYKFDGVSWRAIAPLPDVEAGPSAVSDGTNIYIVGSNVWKYDPVANTYTQRAQYNVSTTGHRSACLGGKIYKMGGLAPGVLPPTASNALEIYDIATDTWTNGAAVPYAASGVSVFSFGSYVYVAGGTILPSSPVNYAYRYDPSTNAWDNSIPFLPEPRTGSVAAAYENGVVLAGGTQFVQVLASALFWDSVSNQWLNLPPMVAQRWGGGGAALNGSFYVVGGLADHTANGTNTNQKLSCTSIPTPTPTPHTPTPTPTATPAVTPIFANISTRLRVEFAANILIGGFIVTGPQPKKVIIRAIGPSLPFPGVLANPYLELRDSSGTLIRANNNWRDEQEAEIIATNIPPSNDLESAIVATLPANGAAYTAAVSGMSLGTGIGVVEVYDLDQAANSKLANISTRGLVQTGDDVLIGGLIILGQTNTMRVILRAIGPSLPVPEALADPMLELHDGNGATIAANDNWRSDQEAEIIATGIPPTNDLESAIVRNLPPGNYTGIVSGVNNTTGVGLVEAYNLSN